MPPLFGFKRSTVQIYYLTLVRLHYICVHFTYIIYPMILQVIIFFICLLLQSHIGMVLVAVNPYELYPIYGAQDIDKYSQQTDMTLLPPHIFSTAQYAFTSMKRRLQNQSIIIRYNNVTSSKKQSPSLVYI